MVQSRRNRCPLHPQFGGWIESFKARTIGAARIEAAADVDPAVEHGRGDFRPRFDQRRSYHPPAAGKPVGRLALKQEWRSGGPRRWRLADQFLADGASLWRGPKEAFVAASWQEVKLRSPNRASLSEEGLDAVRIEIELQRHRRHRPCEG